MSLARTVSGTVTGYHPPDALFTIKLKDDELIFCEPLGEEELRKQQEMKAIHDKLKRQFPGREESS
jgi:hypothetical protein